MDYDRQREIVREASGAALMRAAEIVADGGLEEGHIFVIVATRCEGNASTQDLKMVTSMQAGGLGGDPATDGIDASDEHDVVATLLAHVRNSAEAHGTRLSVIPTPGQG